MCGRPKPYRGEKEKEFDGGFYNGISCGEISVSEYFLIVSYGAGAQTLKNRSLSMRGVSLLA